MLIYLLNNLLSLEILKGSLHTTIFSKYTELLQLKNIFVILWNYFWNILEINVFQNKNQSLFKKCGYFLKNVGHR